MPTILWTNSVLSSIATDLAAIRALHVDVLYSYLMTSATPDADMQSYLDALGYAGLRTMLTVRDLGKDVVYTRGEKTLSGGELATLAAFVNKWKDHPAVWGYYADDEGSASGYPISARQQVYDTIKAAHPDGMVMETRFDMNEGAYSPDVHDIYAVDAGRAWGAPYPYLYDGAPYDGCVSRDTGLVTSAGNESRDLASFAVNLERFKTELVASGETNYLVCMQAFGQGPEGETRTFGMPPAGGLTKMWAAVQAAGMDSYGAGWFLWKSDDAGTMPNEKLNGVGESAYSAQRAELSAIAASAWDGEEEPQMRARCNYLPNPSLEGIYVGGLAPNWNDVSVSTAVAPVYSAVAPLGDNGVAAQRIQYTGVAGDVDASISFRHKLLSDTAAPGEVWTACVLLEGSLVDANGSGLYAQIQMQAWKNDGTHLGVLGQHIVPTATPDVYSYSATMPAETQKVSMSPIVLNMINDGDVVDITMDDATLEKSVSVNEYFDGDSGLGRGWLGPQFASASVSVYEPILAVVAAVQAKTDTIPASPAAVGSAMVLTSAYDKAKDDVLTPLEAVQDAADAVLLRTNTLGGAGAIEWPYTLTMNGTTPIPDAEVWVTTDEAGNNVVASGRTNAFGVVMFYLDAGTYFVWARKAGVNITNMPDTEVVA